ncbi:MAG: acetate--CoA ligase family protein, partial [Planctomycetota bacterium]
MTREKSPSPEPEADSDLERMVAYAKRGLDAVFRPRTVAVIGASRNPHSVGNQVLRNIIRGGFTGSVFPVNPKAHSVHAVKCHPSIRAVPDPVDLAVICVPAALVEEVAKACGEKGVKALCVITAGFREIGPTGRERERRLRDTCREHGMRLVGPNCMGVLNALPDVLLDATIAPSFPRPGHVAFLSQSGAMGVSIIDHAVDLGLGLSMFASIGNKADVSAADLLAYWEGDEATRIVLMYLESFGDPRLFVPMVRRMSRTKPIVCVKAGRTPEAAQAASSHTGALAGADVAVDILMEQMGILRVGTVRDLFDVAQALTTQPLPPGERVAVLTNAGGPAVLAVDFLVGRGLQVARLSEATRTALAAFLVPEASVANPVDMVASAGAGEYRRALPLLLQDPGVDMVIVIFVPPVHVDPREVAAAVFQTAEGADKPVLGCFMAREEVVEALVDRDEGGFPVYAYPEEAVRVAEYLVRVRRLRDDDPGTPETFDDIDHERIAARIRACREGQAKAPAPDHPPTLLATHPVHRRGCWLAATEVWKILEAARLPVVPMRAVDTPDEAAQAARELGMPVALKLQGEAFLHKTDMGALALDLEGEDTVRGAALRLKNLATRLAPDQPTQLLVQPMVRGGVELILGARVDPVFGPVIMVGLGGIYVEVMKDVAFGLVPLTRRLAERMLSRLRGRALLEGTRGSAPVDREALVTAMVRFAAVVDRHPEILEFEMNPLIARPDGVVAVAARVRVGMPDREHIS